MSFFSILIHRLSLLTVSDTSSHTSTAFMQLLSLICSWQQEYFHPVIATIYLSYLRPGNMFKAGVLQPHSIRQYLNLLLFSLL